MSETPRTAPGPDFIRAVVQQDVDAGKHPQVRTRFPPEPNGYLHIGHAKSICLNFGVAKDFGGVCHLRFDDTNPAKEDPEFVESIQRDVRWLGFDWGDNLFFASDYFEQLYAYAEQLIRAGKAFVCSQSEADMRASRGTVTTPGTNSPFRDRSVSENLDLLRRMRAGEFADGEHVVRAKIDMADPNMKMRDPPFYRIRHVHHDRTGDAWCLYPLYDYAHCLSDAIEGISHSVCTLEFENNRELYDWFIDALGLPEPRPRQYEFARLALTYNLMSKRKLLKLVEDGRVSGWDDPRMPTISGMRRLGYTPEGIRAFCDRIGVAKANSLVDIALLEHAIRDDLNRTAPRAMGVVEPLRLIVEGYAGAETFSLPSSPPGAEAVTRDVAFSGELYIDREDFAQVPEPGFRRLAPGREVRLRGAYFVTCTGVDTDDAGRVTAVRCSYDPATRGGNAPDGRKPAATLHWVDAATSVPAEVRLYDRLFASPTPEEGPEGTTFLDRLNPDSLRVVTGRVEAGVAGAAQGTRMQLERVGYFCVDIDSTDERLVLNRTITLRDTWAKPKATSKGSKKKAKPATPASTEGTSASDAVDADPQLSGVRDAAVAAGADRTAATNFVANELRRALGDREVTVDGAAIAGLLALQADGVVSGKATRKVLKVLLDEGGDPAAIVDRLGLRQVSDASALAPIVAQVLADHPGEVERFRAGEAKLMGFLMGRVMRASKGKADPKAASAQLRAMLKP